MQKTLIIFSMVALAGCSSSGVEPFMEHGVVQVNSYIYEDSAAMSKGTPNDLEDATQQVYSEAKARGYDPKAMKHVVRLRKKEKTERETEEAIIDVYKEALGL